jgi:hypothetical protein
MNNAQRMARHRERRTGGVILVHRCRRASGGLKRIKRPQTSVAASAAIKVKKEVVTF